MAGFRGEKYFLSNMFPCTVTMKVNGEVLTMNSSEAVFQSLKCKNQDDVRKFVGINGFEAKKLGKTVEARANWFDMNLDAMRYALKCKFTQNPALAAKLVALEGEIVEINEWNDTFWGVCNGIGQNWLGKLLMELRDELRNGQV